MNLFHIIKQDKAPAVLKLIVEIAKGGNLKYEFNKDYGVLELDRVLYGTNMYPAAYCDVPNTWNGGADDNRDGDNDPLDALFYTTGIAMPGAMVYGKVIGLMLMEDNGEKDHKIICVNDKDYRYKHINDIEDLPDYEKKDLKNFFETYKIAQTGVDTVKVLGFKGKNEAYKVIEDAMDQYKNKFKVNAKHSECDCGGNCQCNH